MYTVKQVCEKLDMSPHTVRHYTDVNLIPFVKRDDHGNRLFDENAMHWLSAAKKLRASGMSIKEVDYYFQLCLKGEETFDERYKILQALRNKVQKELEETQVRLLCIEDKLQHCINIKENKSVDDCNPLNW